MSNDGASPPGGQPQDSLELSDRLSLYVDIWKKTVDVQQHFNDIQWRIRGLALTVATFTLGAAGLAAKDGTRIGFLSLGGTVAVVGLLLWYAFYFVDRYWYHVFLKASVSQGLELERTIAAHLPDSGLASKIKAESSSVYPGALASNIYRAGLSVKNRSRMPSRPTMDSTKRLTWFYAVGSVPFIAVAIVLQTSAVIDVLRHPVAVTNPLPPMTSQSVEPPGRAPTEPGNTSNSSTMSPQATTSR